MELFFLLTMSLQSEVSWEDSMCNMSVPFTKLGLDAR